MRSQFKRTTAALAFAGAALISTTAAAVPVHYVGDLTLGTLYTQTDGLNANDYTQAALWTTGNLWTLSVTAGDIVTVTARRTSNIDPFMEIYDGVISDTFGYQSFYDAIGSTTNYVNSGDDDLSAAVPGSAGYGDPQVTFTAATTGLYTVAVLAFDAPDGGDHGYTIQATGATGTPPSVVPLPATLPLLAFGLGITGWTVRRARKPH